MSNVIGWVAFFFLGFMSAILIYEKADKVPQESPMIAKCSEFGAELKVYNGSYFTCTNGVMFERKAQEIGK